MNQPADLNRNTGALRLFIVRRFIICRFFFLLSIVSLLWSGTSVGAEPAGGDDSAKAETSAGPPIGFTSSRSVEGTMAGTAEQQREGPLARFKARKDELESSTGLTFGVDNHTQYLGTNSDRSPSDAASNVFRFYGIWTSTGRGTPNNGALVFKIEHRSAIGNNISTQALGPSLGYAGVFSSTYSDAGLILTNFYWRQRFAGGRGSFVIGQVDPFDYVNVNSISSPWTAFTNLAFEQQPTLKAPSQGLGAALQWRLDDNWAVLAGIANANGDPSDPLDSAQELFDTGETFKHIAFGWSPEWGDRYDQLSQLTFWQVDEREEAGVEDVMGFPLRQAHARVIGGPSCVLDMPKMRAQSLIARSVSAPVMTPAAGTILPAWL